MCTTSLNSATGHDVGRATLTRFVVVVRVGVAAVLRTGGALVDYGLDVRELAVLRVTGVHGVSLDPVGHTSSAGISESAAGELEGAAGELALPASSPVFAGATGKAS